MVKCTSLQVSALMGQVNLSLFTDEKKLAKDPVGRIDHETCIYYLKVIAGGEESLEKAEEMALDERQRLLGLELARLEKAILRGEGLPSFEKNDLYNPKEYYNGIRESSPENDNFEKVYNGINKGSLQKNGPYTFNEKELQTNF